MLGLLLACSAGLVLELGLVLGTRVSPRLAYAVKAPWDRVHTLDPVLGHRFSPYFPGHDAGGYRNEAPMDACDLLAIGDSLTYGYAAPAAGSWPSQLGAMSGELVYNAGIGGYGPCEYEVVLEELLYLEPQHVIVGLFPANDVADAYTAVYVEERLSALRSEDPGVLETIAAARAAGSLRSLGAARGMGAEATAIESGNGLRGWIAANSKVYGLLRSAKESLASAEAQPYSWKIGSDFDVSAARPFRLPLDGALGCRTVFVNPELDALALDLEDPRIREGLRITLDVLRRMRAAVERRDARFTVALLLNKPAVYARAADSSGEPLPEAVLQVARLEEQLVAELATALDRAGIARVDTGDALADCFESTGCPYPEGDDYHPDEVGYRAIATELLPLIDPSVGDGR